MDSECAGEAVARTGAISSDMAERQVSVNVVSRY